MENVDGCEDRSCEEVGLTISSVEAEPTVVTPYCEALTAQDLGPISVKRQGGKWTVANGRWTVTGPTPGATFEEFAKLVHDSSKAQYH